MHLSTYLSFNGDCEAAFTFYAACFRGKLGQVFRYAGSPMADQVPADWQQKVMHASVAIGDQILMGADVMPNNYEKPQGFSLSLQMSDPAEAERIFDALAKEGAVVMPIEKTFWAEQFGVIVDQFGIKWQVNCE
jgi:PhnB protein